MRGDRNRSWAGLGAFGACVALTACSAADATREGDDPAALGEAHYELSGDRESRDRSHGHGHGHGNGHGHGHGNGHGHGHGHGHGGSAGAGGAGAGGASAGSGGTDPAACLGIRANFACAVEGVLCADLPCGLADVGERACQCQTGLWICEACSFSNSPPEIVSPPSSPLAACDLAIVDGVACAIQGDRCQAPESPASRPQVCACWLDQEGQLIWDCDNQPWP